MVDANSIFAMFQRLDKTRPGTGMGLSVCRRIVEAHDGQLWSESSLGYGTTFYFLLCRFKYFYFP